MFDLEKLKIVSSDVLNKIGIFIYDVEYVTENQDNFLRYYIQREDETMDLDGCVEATEILSKLLDDTDPISDIYFLEVSSPGAERPLKDITMMKAAIQKYVCIEVNEPVEGYNELVGDLLDCDEQKIVLKIQIKSKIKNVDIAMSNIKNARLSVKF